MVPTTAEWLTASEVAHLLKKPVKYVYRLTSERRIRHYKLGNELRFKRSEVDDFVEAGAVPIASSFPSSPTLGAARRRTGRRRIL
ncbi:MAG: helix-turn-helix domain-containing protein [Acidimicrobiales bacterium]|nr:helix-turn-helix domain-containing protein [Acidimicrobiales bacterium]